MSQSYSDWSESWEFGTLSKQPLPWNQQGGLKTEIKQQNYQLKVYFYPKLSSIQIFGEIVIAFTQLDQHNIFTKKWFAWESQILHTYVVEYVVKLYKANLLPCFCPTLMFIPSHLGIHAGLCMYVNYKCQIKVPPGLSVNRGSWTTLCCLSHDTASQSVVDISK